MIHHSRLTAEQFAATKHELPEGGRWQELHDGQPVLMEAPDDLHGTTVLNLSRAFASWLQTSAQASDSRQVATGYACHEIGLKVTTSPDSVYCPAISYFDTGAAFAESDKIIADIVPRLVIEVASTHDRRTELRRRTLAYMDLGVELIWIPDPVKKELQVIKQNAETLALGDRQTLRGDDTLPGFEIDVAAVFKQPEWWGTGRTQ